MRKYRTLFFQLTLCLGFFAYSLYSYINVQNEITKLRIQVPKLTREVRRIEEENTRLLFEVKAFESPENLMKLANAAQFAALEFPKGEEILTVRMPKEKPTEVLQKVKTPANLTFATGAHP